MAYVRGHERVAVAPPAKLSDRLHIILKPMSVQGISRAWLQGKIESVHDPRVQQGFADRRTPSESELLRSFFVGCFVNVRIRLCFRTGGSGCRHSQVGFNLANRPECWVDGWRPGRTQRLNKIGLNVENIAWPGSDIRNCLRPHGRNKRVANSRDKSDKKSDYQIKQVVLSSGR